MDHVGIIGAGPAGIAASIQASKRGLNTVLIDSNPRIGRKLLVTGSGRCNISNKNAAPEKYISSSKESVNDIFSQFNSNDLICFLQQLGVPTYSTEDGWYYPISNSAANVVDIFEDHIKRLGIQTALSTTVENISLTSENKFRLTFNQPQTDIEVNYLVVASGGKAYPNLGSTGNVFSILKKLGHSISPVLPALAPILTDKKAIAGLQGIRLDAAIKLLMGDKLLGQTFGNIIFTEWGINGPGVMDLSYLVSKNENKELYLEIDFLNDHSQQTSHYLKEKEFLEIPLKTLLEAFLPAKLIDVIFVKHKIYLREKICSFSHKEIDEVLQLFNHFKVQVTGTRGFQYAQLSSGGIPLSEIYTRSMASKIIPRMYLAGEVLDVIGPCGGYNLHWAFSSGVIAGRSIGS